ncbi:hypothetical protein SFC66_13735 [Terribacillus saccharophilus]|uniref:GbsR/MarR family transcriptional regulator n=1 Tax=Terribacillus saccharophilus TaxID=361277 RepID=UPI003981F023
MDKKASLSETFISELTRTGELFSLSGTEARLLAILYVENRPITLDQMANLIGKSKTAVSIAIRTLSHQELAERIWVKGERKDFYGCTSHVYEKLMAWHIKQCYTQINRQLETLQHIAQSVPNTDSASEPTQEKLNSSLNFHNQAADLLKKITAISSS